MSLDAPSRTPASNSSTKTAAVRVCAFVNRERTSNKGEVTFHACIQELKRIVRARMLALRPAVHSAAWLLVGRGHRRRDRAAGRDLQSRGAIACPGFVHRDTPPTRMGLARSSAMHGGAPPK